MFEKEFLNETKNHNPPPFKLNGRSQNHLVISLLIGSCLITPREQFVSYIMAKTSYVRWEYNYVCVVLDQHAFIVLYHWNNISGIDISFHIILIPRQPVFALAF